MTEPPPPGPDGPLPDLLAAYVDGELDEATRAAVERWLAAHPEAWGELLAQRELSPANWPLWQKAEPPLPTEDTWALVRDRVEEATRPRPVREPAVSKGGGLRRAGMWLAGAVAAAASAAAVAAWVLGPGGPTRTPAPLSGPEVAVVTTSDDPLAGLDVLPIAGASDVSVERVTGELAGWLPLGLDPLPGPLVLAGADEVELAEVEPSPAWPAGGPELTPGPRDAPMIFATKPR